MKCALPIHTEHHHHHHHFPRFNNKKKKKRKKKRKRKELTSKHLLEVVSIHFLKGKVFQKRELL